MTCCAQRALGPNGVGMPTWPSADLGDSSMLLLHYIGDQGSHLCGVQILVIVAILRNVHSPGPGDRCFVDQCRAW